MKVKNPNEDRPILANIFGQWYEVPAGESIDVDDAAVATSLAEYGAQIDPVDLSAAREVHADTNRGINSRTASASASEGKILGRQQRTVDVARGGVEGGELKGSALEAAVREANAQGAQIKGNADEKREGLREWQTRQGASSPVAEDEFLRDSAGELILDADDQPIPTDTTAYVRDENGAIVFGEDGSPVAVPQDENETPVPDGLGVDDAGKNGDDDK